MELGKSVSSPLCKISSYFDLLPNEIILKIVKMVASRECDGADLCKVLGSSKNHNERKEMLERCDELRKCHGVDGIYTGYDHKFINEVICKLSTRFKAIIMA